MSATAVEENNVTRDIAADRLGKDRLRVGQGGWGPVIDEAQRESRGACACLTKIAGEPTDRLIYSCPQLRTLGRLSTAWALTSGSISNVVVTALYLRHSDSKKRTILPQRSGTHDKTLARRILK